MLNATAVANRLFAATERGDLAAMRACYAPEAVVWHNDGTGDKSIDDNLAFMAFVLATVRSLRYEVLRCDEVTDGAFRHHHLHVEQLDGTVQTLRVAMLIVVADGLITRVEEWFDPRAVEQLIASLPGSSDSPGPGIGHALGLEA